MSAFPTPMITDGNVSVFSRAQWEQFAETLADRWQLAMALRDYSLLRIPPPTKHMLIQDTLGM